jgi:coproporphyrinogen III oxidase-like Fe-S oxidoreductase
MEIINSWYIGWPVRASASLRYRNALMSELELFLNNFSEPVGVQSLLIEGGASVCDKQWLLDTLCILYKRSFFEQGAELSLEVVASVSDVTLRAWKRMGINRVTITCCLCDKHDGILSLFLPRVVALFDNVGVDILLGCNKKSSAWHKSVSLALARPIKHVSVYFDSCDQMSQLVSDEDKSAALYLLMADMLQANDFERYSLYDFARTGYRSRCLQAYLQQKNYKGFGLSGTSLIGKVRSHNTESLDEYCQKLEARQEPAIEQELLTSAALRYEKMRFELGSDTGTDLDQLCGKELLSQLMDGGFLEKVGNNMRFTTKGILVEREIVAKLWLKS